MLPGMAIREVLAALEEHWARLNSSSSDRVRSWAEQEPALTGSRDLLGVLALIRIAPDAVLAALLRLGRGGDQVAFVVVLKAMLGKAVRVSGGRPDALAEAISELWLAIVEYPLERRPRSIAANLAWTLHRRTRASPATWARGLGRIDEPPAVLPEPDATSTLADARQLGLIDELTHRTLWTVYVAGLSSPQAAAVLGTTPELVRWRCSRAIRRLRSQAALLAA